MIYLYVYFEIIISWIQKLFLEIQVYSEFYIIAFHKYILIYSLILGHCNNIINFFQLRENYFDLNEDINCIDLHVSFFPLGCTLEV